MARDTLPNWKKQRKIKKDLEKLKLKIKEWENLITVRFTKAQTYDSMLKTWLTGEHLRLISNNVFFKELCCGKAMVAYTKP